MYKSLLLFICLLFSSAAFAEENIDISIEASVNKSGFVGQTLEYVVKLKSNIPNVADIRMVKGANFPSEIQVIKGHVSNQRPQEETIKGKKYYVWTISRNFLIPNAAGKYTIPESKYIAFVPYEKIVRDYFWNNMRIVDYEEYPVTCKGVSFKVDDLPSKGKPADFTGCVGDFTIEGWFPPGNIIIGKEAVVAFTISGYGDLDNLKIPNLSGLFKNGCSLREIEQNDEKSQKNGRMFSEVTLICRFIPETEDGFITPLSLSFFNPEKKQYETVSSFTLHWDKKSTVKPSGKVEAIEI